MLAFRTYIYINAYFVIFQEKVIDLFRHLCVSAHNQRKELSEFLNDGRIPLTNSAAERAVRPFAVHRKNWLFADTVEGAKANAVLYSIVETAKANSLNSHNN